MRNSKNKVKILFYSTLRLFRKSISSCGEIHASPVCPFHNISIKKKVSISTDRKHRSAVRYILHTVQLTSNGLGSNPGLRSEGSVQECQENMKLRYVYNKHSARTSQRTQYASIRSGSSWYCTGEQWLRIVPPPPSQCPHMSLWTSWSSLLGTAEV